MSDNDNPEQTNGMWAVVELMGHVKIAGYVTEEERCGATLGRIDIPLGDGNTMTHLCLRVGPARTADSPRLCGFG